MFIRRTQTRTAPTGETCFTHRLVRSERIASKVRQRTLLNLGRHFETKPEDWPALCRRIDELLCGQLAMHHDVPPVLFLAFPRGTPWELAGLFRRRIAWDDGAIREPVGAVAVAFPMSRCCRSGEDVGARAASVGKGWASAQHLSMPCPHAPQDAARSEGRVHILTAGVVGVSAVVSASLGTREELARAGDTTPPGHDRCSFATRRG